MEEDSKSTITTYETQLHGWDLNRVPPKYKAVALLIGSDWLINS